MMLPVLVVSSLLSTAVAASNVQLSPVCAKIARSISSKSAVYPPGDPNYLKDIEHWSTASTQSSQCSVEPGTSRDVATILKILGSTRTPFAVKGGGHASNPGFSSTPGVQISMTRFNETTYHAHSQTATVGSGLIWDDVYAALVPQGVNIVGGRVPGVGVAGFTLGGGYSWNTNQYGLTVDTVKGYELVKPNGEIAFVTHQSDPELFFGLKGGFNNFGIVTRFELETHKQGLVWGGFIVYDPTQATAFGNAVAKFSSDVKDPKASLIAGYNYLEAPFLTVSLFYDGPNPPAGIFDDFLAITSLQNNVRTSDYLTLVQSVPAESPIPKGKAVFHSTSLKSYSPSLLGAIFNETNFWGTQLTTLLASGLYINFAIEPFLHEAYKHNKYPSAFPPSSHRGDGLLPFNAYFGWATDLLDGDKTIYASIKQSIAQIQSVAEAEGQKAITTSPIYPNYAIFDTPLEHLYSENVGRLRALKRRVDPHKVMDLAGGFKF